MDWAVLLMAYGGPDSLEDIEPYLLDVRGGRETPPALVAKIRDRYAAIGGRSPLLAITYAQAVALEERLNAVFPNRCRVFVGMRHWKPYIREAVAEIQQAGLTHITALCMAPHHSKMSVGAYQEKLRQALQEFGIEQAVDVRMVDAWHDHPLFIQALAEKAHAAEQKFALQEREDLFYLFSAHSLPAAIMEQGDPYADQLAVTARLLAHTLNLPEDRWQLCYQSAGAQNTRWLGPGLEEVLADQAAQGRKAALVVPIGFVADHVEILYDIDIEARETARALGIHLERSESMNATPGFIRALADIVNTAINKPRTDE